MKKINKCLVCGKPTTRRKFCSDKCQKKNWKLTHREDYLEGKKAYKKRAKDKVNAYNRKYRKEIKAEELRKKLELLEKEIKRLK